MPGSVDSLLAHRRRFIQAAPVPIELGEVQSVENTGTQRLELMLVGVARDLCKEMEYMERMFPVGFGALSALRVLPSAMMGPDVSCAESSH